VEPEVVVIVVIAQSELECSHGITHGKNPAEIVLAHVESPNFLAFMVEAHVFPTTHVEAAYQSSRVQNNMDYPSHP
jgi:hypothetical protein